MSQGKKGVLKTMSLQNGLNAQAILIVVGILLDFSNSVFVSPLH